jgi:hypothetical protein
MYVVQEYLICVLIALPCTGLVFSVWVLLVLAKEGAKFLGDFARNAIASRGQINDRNFASWREVVREANIVASGGGKSITPPNYVIGRSDDGS